MSLTGTRKNPFLLPDSLPLNNIKRSWSSYFSPILASFFPLNLLDFLLNSSLHVPGGGGAKEKKNTP